MELIASGIGDDVENIAGRPAKGTFGHLCLAYYASEVFKALDKSTKAWRRRAFFLMRLIAAVAGPRIDGEYAVLQGERRMAHEDEQQIIRTGLRLSEQVALSLYELPELAPLEGTERAFALFYTGTIGSGAISPVIYGFLGDRIGIHGATFATALTALATFPLAIALRSHLAPEENPRT